MFNLSLGVLYLVPAVLMVLFIHRRKWNRTTDYGALAQAKLAMPADWPTWIQNRDLNDELERIRERNNGTHR